MSGRPTEMSSKRPVSRFRTVFAPVRPKPRDPRFDDLCGELDRNRFTSAYGFIQTQKKQELQDAEKVLHRCTDAEERAELKERILELKNEIRDFELETRVQNRIASVKKEEHAKVAEGKRPFYLKKGELKKIALEEKYKQLKEKGSLQSYMVKKRKSNAKKDKRWMPERKRNK